jgi:predicted enzyme related to lactoylglutathione lyase
MNLKSKNKEMKTRVTGLGGIFFKTKDSKATKAWYAKHLGLPVDDYGCTFWWTDQNGKDASTQWSPFKEDTSYFEPSKQPFMINYRVENLNDLITVLRSEGVTIVGQIQTFDYGKFAWILDPEGNKIELWEPIDSAFKK